MITNYSKKKLIEYLQPGQRVLIRFGHGLGDTLMFIPILEELRRRYPETKIDLYVESGQEKIWESAKDKDDPSYDLIFHLDFPMSEGSDETKAGRCCRAEIGIEPISKVASVLPCPNPIVAVHFNGTALPESVGCPEPVAKQIWDEIKSVGMIPFECHFEHCWHNPVNKKFDFVTSTARGCEAKLSSLFGLLQNSRAFIGVASGPFVAALSIVPERMFFLERAHKLRNYTDLKLPKADVNNYKPGSVAEWLKTC
jgi:hypothetical protein